jgi:hypothetical protein
MGHALRVVRNPDVGSAKEKVRHHSPKKMQFFVVMPARGCQFSVDFSVEDCHNVCYNLLRAVRLAV